MEEMMPNRIEVNKADPFDINRLWGDEKYNLQNMLMRQVNFPAYCYERDIMWSVYHDRAYDTFYAACEKYLKPMGGGLEGGSSLNALSSEKFLEFCREAIGCDKPITGARFIRYTNVSSGYPCYRIDVYAKGEGNPEVPTYSDMNAPNVNRQERDIFYDRKYWQLGF